MSLKIQSAIRNVENLLSGAMKRKVVKKKSVSKGGPRSAKQALTDAKKALSQANTPSEKKEARARVTKAMQRVKKLSGFVSGNKAKILAMLSAGSKPNLRLLNKMINRGQITSEEVVAAISEALLLKRVNKRVIEAIGLALREALGGDVIDVEQAA